jgi:hypothetical protein
LGSSSHVERQRILLFPQTEDVHHTHTIYAVVGSMDVSSHFDIAAGSSGNARVQVR